MWRIRAKRESSAVFAEQYSQGQRGRSPTKAVGSARADAHAQVAYVVDLANYSFNMRMWRNWQTRMIQVHVGNHAGSSPVIRTRYRK